MAPGNEQCVAVDNCQTGVGDRGWNWGEVLEVCPVFGAEDVIVALWG
jgi:hypothetical protein